MSLQFLEINNLRNIEKQAIEFSPGVNVFYGQNGSGKTSILEAIHVLGTGKSFRSSQISKVIRHGEKELLLFGRIVNTDGSLAKIGVRRTNSETEIRADGERIETLSQLARKLPIAVVTPESHQLLDAGPGGRRRFLDWGVFHVEHDYPTIWRQFNQCLKQRNALLQAGEVSEQLRHWSNSLVELGELLDTYRKRHFDRLRPFLTHYADVFLENCAVEFSYYQGWQRELSLEDALDQHRDQDIQQRRTGIGPQRAEIKIRFNGMNAREAVSRGQQKLLVYAMQLAQTRCLYDVTKKYSLLLLDDLGAELDEEKSRVLMDLIETEFGQVVITSAVDDSIPIASFKERKVFHVEHGKILSS